MKQYEMTKEQHEKLLKACEPVRMIALNCGTPRNPQKNVNDAWEALGKEMGFHPYTVEPSSKGELFFRAEEVQ